MKYYSPCHYQVSGEIVISSQPIQFECVSFILALYRYMFCAVADNEIEAGADIVDGQQELICCRMHRDSGISVWQHCNRLKTEFQRCLCHMVARARLARRAALSRFRSGSEKPILLQRTRLSHQIQERRHPLIRRSCSHLLLLEAAGAFFRASM